MNKRDGWMKSFTKIVFLLVILWLCAYSTAFSQNKFKLKPDAGGKQCLSCHDNFKNTLKKQFLHTPVKTGQCTGCHDPHTSSHGKLLADEPNKICATCHKTLVPQKARSVHKVAVEGNCVKCHDPHGSDNRFNLVKAANNLCFDCHKSMGDTLAKVKFKHSPVDKGCVNCHDPHASAKADHLLKNDENALCLGCHKPDRPNFAKAHMNYSVVSTRCSSCHNPHGSNKAGIMFDNVHAPVANKMCGQCHEGPASPTPLKVKRAGFELCRGCHNTMMNETFNKNRIHWPLVDKVGCANCHEPHASPGKGLLKADRKNLCGQCHADTMAIQEKLADKEKQEKAAAGKGQIIKGALTHQPIQDGDCSSCHSPHASDATLLLKQSSIVELCGTCHDWLKHTSHPMGEKVTDSRNKNLKVDCLSCHRAHGTGHRYIIPFPTANDLCVQCHKQYRR
jgi:DmsE family decaheme c-type cytochrome